MAPEMYTGPRLSPCLKEEADSSHPGGGHTQSCAGKWQAQATPKMNGGTCKHVLFPWSAPTCVCTKRHRDTAWGPVLPAGGYEVRLSPPATALQSWGVGSHAFWNSSLPLLSLFCHRVGSSLSPMLAFLRVGSDWGAEEPADEKNQNLGALSSSFRVCLWCACLSCDSVKTLSSLDFHLQNGETREDALPICFSPSLAWV